MRAWRVKVIATETVDLSPPNHERLLLTEIGEIADRVRDLRQSDAMRHTVQIKELTGHMRSKWAELRALRAPPGNDDPLSRGRKGHYG
jgi:hypothetical protein